MKFKKMLAVFATKRSERLQRLSIKWRERARALLGHSLANPPFAVRDKQKRRR